MALIKCPECGREISDQADKCPSCGYPVKAEKGKNKLPKPPKKKIILIASVLLAICIAVGTLLYFNSLPQKVSMPYGITVRMDYDDIKGCFEKNGFVYNEENNIEENRVYLDDGRRHFYLTFSNGKMFDLNAKETHLLLNYPVPESLDDYYMEVQCYIDCLKEERDIIRNKALEKIKQTHGEPDYEDDLYWSWSNSKKDGSKIILALTKTMNVRIDYSEQKNGQ